MGNSQSSSGTQFASAGLPVLQSIKPCQLSGDPDLYGIGIRVGFYLQYAAAIIAIVTGIDQEFVGWRAAFVPLAGATFIGLCINSTANTLVIMDWAIMLELVLWFPAFFALPVLKGFPKHFKATEQLRLSHKYSKKLELDREASFEHYRQRLAVVSGALINVVDAITEDTTHSRLEARRLVHRLARVAHDWDNVIKDRPAEMANNAEGSSGEELGRLESAVNGVRAKAQNNIQALAALQREIDAAQLGRRPRAALQQAWPTIQEANKAYDGILETVKEEKATTYHIKWQGFVLKRIHDLGFIDTVCAGISLIIYSAYCFLTPWLFFVGIDRGAKSGCDIKVLFFFAPISVYNHGFVIFLKVAAVIATVFGVIYLTLGGMFLIVGLSDPFEEVERKRKESAEKQRAKQSAQPNIQNGRELMPMAMAQSQEAHVHRHWITAHTYRVEKLYHEYVKDDSEFSKKAVNKHLEFNPFLWGIGLALCLTYTIVVVEKTIKVNHLTSGTLLSSTGQLIALLVGIFMLLVILYRCLVKLYKHSGCSIKFTLPQAVRNLLARILGKLPGNKDPESQAGLVSGDQVHESARRSEPQVIEDRAVEEVSEEPLPVHAVV